MASFLARRLLLIIPTLLGVTLLVSGVLYLAPGDPAQALVGEHASPERVAEIKREFGLDQPFLVQYGRFLTGALSFDFGRSPINNTYVGKELLSRFPATLELTLVSMLIAVLIGVPLGLLAAAKRDTWIDAVAMSGSVFGVSFPIFFLGMILVSWFGGILPGGERLMPMNSVTFEPITGLFLLDALLQGNWAIFKDAVIHIILPAITLATVPMGVIARMSRAAAVEIIDADYIRTARAKGLSGLRVMLKHVLRNASVPITTIVGLQLGYLLAGAVLTETIFNWPGVGLYVFEAIDARDVIAVRAAVLMIAVTFVLVNLVVDFAYAVLDPRIRVDA
jgi:peptide/nickel transport system permease protein